MQCRQGKGQGRRDGPEPVGDLALLLVGLDEHARVAHEMRVALAEDDLHRLGVDEGDEAEHALLLVRDAHVLHRPEHAARSMATRTISRFRSPIIGLLEPRGTEVVETKQNRAEQRTIMAACCAGYLK